MQRAAKWGVLAVAVLALSGLVVGTLPVLTGSASSSSANSSSVNGNSGNAKGGCPDSNAIGNFLESPDVGASVAKGASTWTYYFSSLVDLSPSNGVPGLIEYCVYPVSGSLPSSSTVSATGADGNAFTTVSGSTQGYFGFARSHGNPSNIPLDGTHDVLMGTGTWTGSAPTSQVIVLHINDAAACQGLYGGNSSTCFVLPHGTSQPLCGGQATCKTASVREATSTVRPFDVPMNTQLHITYTFTVVNQPTNSYDMEFLFPAGAPPNFTGVRDHFNCTQVPDPNGTPGAVGTYSNYQGSGLSLYLHYLNVAGNCPNLVLRATAASTTIVLHPGDSITFTVATVTGPNGFTTPGLHCLNKGVTVVWFESDDSQVHTYTSPDVDVMAV